MKPPVYDSNWSEELKAVYGHDIEEIWDRTLAPYIWNRYHNQLDIYRSFANSRPLDILDVGCAQGTLALLLAEDGHNVTAIDLRPEFLSYAASRYTHGCIQFVQANALTDNLSGRYDLIYANQIIEHLVYPEAFVARLSELLKPGGRLVMATPNHAYIKNSLPSYTELGDPKKWEHLQFTADGDGHFFAYTAAELLGILSKSKLAELSVISFESPLISGHMKFRYLHNIFPAKALQTLDRLVHTLPVLSQKLGHQLLATGIKVN